MARNRTNKITFRIYFVDNWQSVRHCLQLFKCIARVAHVCMRWCLHANATSRNQRLDCFRLIRNYSLHRRSICNELKWMSFSHIVVAVVVRLRNFHYSKVMFHTSRRCRFTTLEHFPNEYFCSRFFCSAFRLAFVRIESNWWCTSEWTNGFISAANVFHKNATNKKLLQFADCVCALCTIDDNLPSSNCRTSRYWKKKQKKKLLHIRVRSDFFLSTDSALFVMPFFIVFKRW